MERSDNELMERARTGDRTSFDLVVRRYQKVVQGFATRMLNDSSRGAEVSVEAFVKLWGQRDRYQSDGKLKPWLLRTAYRLCLDSLKQESWCGALDVLDASLERQIERDALASAVRKAIQELPESLRAVILLSTYESLSYAEIADALDIPVGTVASRRSHALDLLRRKLAAWETK